MSVIAAAVVTSAAAGVYSANRAAKQQAKATDAATAAASDQNALSREQFDWNKQIYERDVAPMQRRQQELQERVANDAMARAAKQDALADEQYSYYKTNYRPVEERNISDAMGYDSMDNIDRRSGIAAANLNQQFSNARGQSARMAGRYGLGSTAFSGPMGSSERAQALGTAGAATGAAFDTVDKAIQLRAGVTNLGRGNTNTALAGWGGANSSSGVAGGAANSALAGTMSAPGFMNSAYNNRFSNIGTVGNTYFNAYKDSSNWWGDQAASFGRLAGGLFQRGGGGSMFGFGSPGFSGGQAPAPVSDAVMVA